jgi:nitrate/nitrite transporter NarK
VLAASGLVAGEGLAGVLVAGLVAMQVVARTMTPRLSSVAGDVAVIAMLAMICVFLYRAAHSAR